MTIRNLENAFMPDSVALIGASEQPGSVGLKLMENMREGGFSGPIRLVNPRHDTIGGERAYRNIGALPEAPSLG